MDSVLTDQGVTMMAQAVTTKEQELGCSWLKVLAQEFLAGAWLMEITQVQPSPGMVMANRSHTGVPAKPWDGHG